MATLSLDLSKAITDDEQHAANELITAALLRDRPEIERLLADATIRDLFKRGVLKTDRTVFCFDGEELELS